MDNLRRDVYFSPRVVEPIRASLGRMIARHGGLEHALQQQEALRAPREALWARATRGDTSARKSQPEPGEVKRLCADLLLVVLDRAKDKENILIDLLGRVALIKLLRSEMAEQFGEVLERCRILQKSLESTRGSQALGFREKVAAFQVGKKNILRKTGLELLNFLREIEKETLARTRRSIFGEKSALGYELLLNPLLFTEDGRDDHVNAEHYVMWGNFDRDHDRFLQMRQHAVDFLQKTYGVPEATAIEGWLNVPENAQALVGNGSPDESTDNGAAQQVRLAAWLRWLEENRVMESVLAAYEAAPLVPEYASHINPQQLKNALISREELGRVETMIRATGMSPANLRAARQRMSGYGSAERTRVAGRFLFDLMRYHRDLRRLEALDAAVGQVNVIQNDRLRELSAMNGLLHEFILPDERTRKTENVLSHVILKADVRDSTLITRRLMEMGLNAASYFSLNFYEPVNRLLATYGATKVFLEGDAIILALLDREGERGFTVARACVLAREIIEIVRGYNQRLESAGLPTLEVGVGVCHQDAPPLYLMDGDRSIMISDAINESDRLSSCSKVAQRLVTGRDIPFNVYAFQTVQDPSAGEAQEFSILYNRNGVRLSEGAFQKLRTELSLLESPSEFPRLWDDERSRLFSGLVPVDREVFRPIIVREARTLILDAASRKVSGSGTILYYELVTNPTVYTKLSQARTAKA